MKRTLVSLLSLLALSSLFTITSCQKDATGDGTQFRATMEGCAARDGKTILDETFLHLNWVEGDQVAIYGTAGRGLYSATPQTPATTAVFDNVGGTTGDGPFRAFYPASLTSDGATVTLPATQTYEVNSIHEFPMYAESATNQLAFKNLCGALRLILVEANTNITSISITANTAICGDYAVSYVNDVPYLSYTGNGSNTVTMNFSTPLSIGDTGRYFYFALPAFDSLKSITITTDDGRYCTKTVKSNVCINVQRSEMTTIVFLDNDMDFVEPLPEGALPGLFSVSPTQQVRFSKGNLQYQASTDTWRFAENQWDYVGNDNDNISLTYTGWIDLFAWGTGNNPIQGSIITYSDFSTFVDWGVNPISNGGNQNNSWRTLSNAEWDYILYSRSGSQIGDVWNASFVWATVNNVQGLIIFPDIYNHPAEVIVPRYINSPNSNGSYNNYSVSEWSEMEDAGAVFLPAAGLRVLDLPPTTSAHLGTNGVNQVGVYWTSSIGHDNVEGRIVGLLYFGNSRLSTGYGGWAVQCERYSVRLIQDNE